MHGRLSVSFRFQLGHRLLLEVFPNHLNISSHSNLHSTSYKLNILWNYLVLLIIFFSPLREFNPYKIGTLVLSLQPWEYAVLAYLLTELIDKSYRAGEGKSWDLNSSRLASQSKGFPLYHFVLLLGLMVNIWKNIKYPALIYDIWPKMHLSFSKKLILLKIKELAASETPEYASHCQESDPS